MVSDESKSSAPTSKSSTPAKLQRLLAPSWLAGLISVGVHGVLFAAAPTFSSLGFSDIVEPELAVESRDVPLVELTPAEQERLPDFSQSLYDLESFGNLDPLSPLFGDQPSVNGEADADAVPQVPSPLTSRRPLSIPSSQIPLGTTRIRSRSPLAGLPRNSGLPSLPSNGNSSQSDAPTQGGSAATPGSGNGNAAGPGASSDGQTETASREPSAADLEGSGSSRDRAAIELPQGTERSNPTEVLTLEEQLQAYTYDDANTSPEAVEEQFDAWLSSGRALIEDLGIESDATETDDAALGSLEDAVKTTVELPIPYEGVCLTKAPQKGLIGAWVGPDGSLLEDPKILRSTGYLGLNRQALQYIETLDFSAVEVFTGYQFEVVVDYNPENCSQLGSSSPQPYAPSVAEDSDKQDADTQKTEADTIPGRREPAAPGAANPNASEDAEAPEDSSSQ